MEPLGRSTKPATKAKRAPRASLPVWKKGLFATLTLVLFFVAMETVLWGVGVRPLAVETDPFVGFSARLPLYVSDSSAGELMMVTAENKQGLFNVQRFSRRKPSGVRRVFCLGGSTTFGHPYDDRASFAAWLRELLSCDGGAGKWEIINAGGISYASYRVAALMQELIQYEPDLFIIYTGHNEFLERRTYRNFFELPPLLRDTSALLSRTRTYTLLRRVLVADNPRDGNDVALPPEVDARLDHTVGPADYDRDDRQRQRIVEHLRFNLRRMIDLARSAGAEVIFVTPAANLKDCSPFKSQHRAGLGESDSERWSQRFAAGRRHQAAADWQAATKEFRAALRVDDRYAEVHYRLGQCLIELGQAEQAHQAFCRARDEDVCPLRASAEILEAVRQAAREQQCMCVDFAEQVSRWSLEQSGSASPGRGMFLDHVHLTQELTSRLAKLLVDELVRRNLVRAAASDDCLAEATKGIEARLGPEERAAGLRNIAKVFSWAGKIEEAGPAALAALELAPADRESLFIAGAYLKQTDQNERAMEFYRRALELEVAEHPQDVEAHQFLAKAWAEQEQWSKARAEYQAALRLRPDSIEAHYGLATILIEEHERDTARRHLEQVLRLDAGHSEARAALERLDKTRTAD
jgi:tetratricopeptide (TPR) repeat protein